MLWLHSDPTGTFRMLGSASLLTDAGGNTVGQAREDAIGGIDFAQARFLQFQITNRG